MTNQEIENKNLKELFRKQSLGQVILYTKQELFIAQAPSFNFELNADQLVTKGLEVGFITVVGKDQSFQTIYEVNQNY
tara:strand:- start:60 stop:293 length:234 start_codon:yes stop_codon:yes gene_type:complete